MIYLKNNVTNKIVLTGSENLTGYTSGSTFTLILTNQQTLIPTTYYLVDISPNPERYNQFNLYLSSTTLNSGYYDYDLEYSGTSVEIGKCLIDFAARIETIYSGNTPTIYVYNP